MCLFDGSKIAVDCIPSSTLHNYANQKVSDEVANVFKLLNTAYPNYWFMLGSIQG